MTVSPRSAVALVRLVLSMLGVVAMACATSVAYAQVPQLSAALRVPNPAGKTQFGGAVAGRAGKIVVGPGINASGGVHVLDGATGALLVTIANPAPAADDWFGAAVAWVGDDVLVGAPLSDVAGLDRGVAYLFDGATGALLQTFTRPDAVPGWFGYAVAGYGDDALIGVEGLLGPNGEGAYLFDGATGALLQSFSDPNAGTPLAGRFGRTVVVDGADVLIASTFGASAVYRFDAAGTLLETYADPEPEDAEEFGAAVAVVAGRVAVGTGVTAEGAVYLFDAASGALEHVYDPPFASDSSFFGMSLAGVGDLLAIGSTDGVFLYQPYPSYGPTQRLAAPAPFSDDRDSFGRALAALDDGLVVGALRTVYVFDPCGNGVRTAREQCDDGNPISGDGCSFACRLETCGELPAGGCVPATKSQISLRDENSVFGIKDAFKWTWAGAATDVATLGDPLATTDLLVCVYDRTETVSPRLRMQPAMLAGGTCGTKPCWRPSGSSGWAYKDKERTPSGIAGFAIKTGTSTKLKVSGAGPDLGVPEIATVPLAGEVTVQLRSSTSPVCLSATFASPPQVNAGGVFKSRTP